MPTNESSFAEKAALAALLLLTAVVSAALLGFAFHIPLGWYTFAAAFAALAVPMAVFDRQLLAALLLDIGLIAVWSVACAFLFDWSYDGMYYHKQAIITLKEGWNPLWQGSAEADVFATYLDEALWLDNYPKGVWIFSAVIYSITNVLETAKAVNLLFLLPVFCVGYDVLHRTYGYSSKKSFAFSVLLGLNPVFICQVFTSYNDLAVGALIITAALICFKIYHGCASRQTYAVCFCVAAFSCVVKFTAPLYVGLVFLTFGVCYAFRIKWKWASLWRPAAVILCGFLIGASLIGFDPYIKHILHGQHPLYPVMGEGKYDIMNINPPKSFDEMNGLARLGVSLFSQTENNTAETPKPKLPFSIHAEEFDHLATADIRIGGFGIWFSGILITSVVLVLIAAIHRTRFRSCTLIALLLFTAMALVMPETWWARYASYIYYIPVFALLYASGDVRWRWKTVVQYVLIAANSAMFLWAVPAEAIQMELALREKLNEIKAQDQKIIVRVNDFPSHIKLFEEAGIRFEVSHDKIEDDPLTFYRTTKYKYVSEK